MTSGQECCGYRADFESCRMLGDPFLMVETELRLSTTIHTGLSIMDETLCTPFSIVTKTITTLHHTSLNNP